MNIIAFAGSLRLKSFNRGLLRAALKLKPQGMDIDIFDLSPIPVYNKDVELQGLPESVLGFKRAIEGSEGILIATPEHNWSMPGVLKNAIDWASRPQNSFAQKPIAIMGASTGTFATARSQISLLPVFWDLAAYVAPKPVLLVGDAESKFDSDSNLTDQPTRDRLIKFLEGFHAWVNIFLSSKNSI